MVSCSHSINAILPPQGRISLGARFLVPAMFLFGLLMTTAPAASTDGGGDIHVTLPTTLRGIPNPTVYWVSNPVYENETVLVAGAGLGDVAVRLCADAECRTHHVPDPTAVVWEHSAQFRLPAQCGPGA